MKIILTFWLSSIVLVGIDSFATCGSNEICIEETKCPKFNRYKGLSTKPPEHHRIVKKLCDLNRNDDSAGANVCCPTPINSLQCGLHINERRDRELNAHVFQFPWMALLRGVSGAFLCGGTLISSRYVLTAAHCAVRGVPVVSVRLGETNIHDAIDCTEDSFGVIHCADPPLDIDVIRVIRHPRYSQRTKTNDIALLRLKRRVDLSNSVRPICLPKSPSELAILKPEFWIVSGWGQTKEGGSFETLRFGKVLPVEMDSCSSRVRTLDTFLELEQSQICAGGDPQWQPAWYNCPGDSGGPLQYISKRNSRLTQHGIVSYGVKMCGLWDEPSIYTNVASYLDWIITVVNSIQMRQQLKLQRRDRCRRRNYWTSRLGGTDCRCPARNGPRWPPGSGGAGCRINYGKCPEQHDSRHAIRGQKGAAGGEGHVYCVRISVSTTIAGSESRVYCAQKQVAKTITGGGSRLDQERHRLAHSVRQPELHQYRCKSIKCNNCIIEKNQWLDHRTAWRACQRVNKSTTPIDQWLRWNSAAEEECIKMRAMILLSYRIENTSIKQRKPGIVVSQHHQERPIYFHLYRGNSAEDGRGRNGSTLRPLLVNIQFDLVDDFAGKERWLLVVVLGFQHGRKITGDRVEDAPDCVKLPVGILHRCDDDSSESLFLLVGCCQFTSCSCRQECIPFEECADFKSYHGVPNRNWPASIRTQVREQICGRSKDGGVTIYNVCCSKNVPSTKKGLGLLDFECCGRVASDRVAFGKNARVFQFPWMALIKDSETFVCGGSLITPSHVLTAAHCFRTLIVSVRLGETDLSKEIDCNAKDDCAPKPQDIAVDKVVKHPLYSSSKKKNDIGIVKLSRPAKLGDSVETICLPIQSKIATTPSTSGMFITGWGATEHDVSSDIMQYAKVPITSNAACTASYKSKGYSITVDESHVCAGGKDRVENCIGDSGGPLQYFNENSITIQHGVVSYGLQTCGVDNLPGVYARVSYYNQWILDNLN
ncbi:uncharacterized protein LOC129742080 [Uranotaenia lowii]|uniref:uncharacterized protein LOC129742080 n=1 Tax=Uranotaenia lowii TaxID=190385 RepID=UPI002479DED4|nr:uncharacterized protein LOC129742080 [Uranotaenia lowii]